MDNVLAHFKVIPDHVFMEAEAGREAQVSQIRSRNVSAGVVGIYTGRGERLRRWLIFRMVLNEGDLLE